MSARRQPESAFGGRVTAVSLVLSPRCLIILALFIGIAVAVAGPLFSPLLVGGPLLMGAALAWVWHRPDAGVAALAFLIPLQVRLNLPGDWSLALGFVAICGLAAVAAYRGLTDAACPTSPRGLGDRDASAIGSPTRRSRATDKDRFHYLLPVACWLLIAAGLASLFPAAQKGEAFRRGLYLGWFLLLLWLVPQCVRSPEAVVGVTRAGLAAASLAALIGVAQFAAQLWVGALPLMTFWIEFVTPILEGERVAASYLEHGTNWVLWVGGQPILRAIGPFSGPPDVAQYLGIALPIAIALALSRPRLRGRELAALSILILFLLLSFSRQGWVGIVAGLLVIAAGAAATGGRMLSRRVGLLLAVAGLSATTALVAGSLQREGPLAAVVDRLRSFGDPGDVSSLARFETWRTALVLAEERPLLGAGLGNYGSAAGERRGTYSHNTYLDLLVETGPLGLLGLLLLLAWAATGAWHVAYRGQTPELRAFGLGALGAVAALALIFFFDDAFFFPRAGQAFWLLLGLIAAGARFAPPAPGLAASPRSP